VEQMKLLVGNDKITRQPLEHPTEAALEHRRDGVGLRPHESARLPLGAEQSKYRKRSRR
jgi:hypothetical protein